ncbi:cytochrome c-type biogenesis protein CcsB [Nocardioides luteus]|uniref:C-type cytochrome biogenesis protein CcsB n=1 Tax=Nocardioides luteus TaxID=1844 RepID=A0ABQ5SQM8_9ACTN|nr:c-type cytochrome biogenesis protein CcsB [Nocardioides luteus]MDR7313391.1 cytochrome c-type biogenesis protein CcsB [Nocardioides luteus]GGR60635.1 c-type cytochrome biogenesis protein CcsB [Nocardioides luteus]GLJ66457.1 c-type cytochrome biogenesis protein CcsB [Nocardioides luteus]
MTDHTWGVLSNQAITAAGTVYFLALLCAVAEWSAWLSRAKASVAEKELVGAGAAADETETPADAAAAVREQRAALFGRLSLLLTVIAVACHLVALVSRGMAADPNRVPWGNMYEFTISGSFVVAAAYVVLYRRLKLAWMATWVLGFTFVVLMLAVVGLYEPVAPLTEALNSYWLVIHVIAAIIATGAFTLGGIASVAYLLKKRYPDATLLARVPELEALDRVSYRIHAFAFPVWTFGVLISGPIWAHEAWGSYWNWDPKEVWAFITWVVYAGYLHARATAGWKGKKAAIVALVGLATLWFNFIGINYFSSTSQHSYAAPAPTASVVEVVETTR